jgi:hypothetical protein
MAEIKIAVINASTTLSDADVRAVVPALQAQVRRDFAPAWGVDADLAFVPKGGTAAPGAWWLVVLDTSDAPGALGYHDLTPEGLPLGKVFAETDRKLGLRWTVTASHELLEMLVDPNVNLTVFIETGSTTGTLYAYEVCDACEADEFGYSIEGVMVSDFVYPAWFESFRKKGSTRFDHREKIQEPFGLLRGGYIGVYEVKSGSGWTQVTAEPGTGASPIGSRIRNRSRHMPFPKIRV